MGNFQRKQLSLNYLSCKGHVCGLCIHPQWLGDAAVFHLSIATEPTNPELDGFKQNYLFLLICWAGGFYWSHLGLCKQLLSIGAPLNLEGPKWLHSRLAVLLGCPPGSLSSSRRADGLPFIASSGHSEWQGRRCKSLWGLGPELTAHQLILVESSHCPS